MKSLSLEARLLIFFGVVLLVIVVSPRSHLHAAEQQELVPSPLPSDIQYVLVNTEFTLLHELGHALIAELNLPVLGREEDAADQLATMIFLTSQHPGLEGSLTHKITSIGIELRIEAAQDKTDYWDSHPTAIQRFYNLLCLAYGKDPDSSNKFLENNWLPLDRAWYCDTEYEQVARATHWVHRQYGRPEGFPLPDRDHDSDRKNLHSASSADQAPQQIKSGRVTVTYDPPTTPTEEFLLEKLKASTLIEHLAKQVERDFRLPRDLTISFSNCYDDAYWAQRTGKIIMCYSLMELYYDHSKKAEEVRELLPDHLTPLNMILPTEIFKALKAHAAEENSSINDTAVEALKKYLKSQQEN